MAPVKQAIATLELPTFTDHSVKEIITLHPWMRDVTFTLLTRPVDVTQYIDRCIQRGRCAYDLETTGLNTRLNQEGKPWDTISGIGIASSPTDGAYIPITHEYYANNIPISFIIKETQRLIDAKTKLIFHNFKFDAQMMRNYGLILNDWELFDDTYLMAAIWDASRKNKRLKDLSEQLLQRKMLELNELGLTGKGREQSIHLVPPQKALYYVASDVMCTYGLFEYFSKAIDEQDPKKTSGPWNVYGMEKRCLPVTMEMERNMVRIDKKYLEQAHKDVVMRMKVTMEAIYKYAGREVDINSPKQLGVLLFEELKIPHPYKGKDGKDKTKSGQWSTDVDTMEAMAGKHPIADAILKYRSLEKIKGTYIENFLKNADWNDEVKFQLNQVAADTGRYSSSGGSGLEGDGYAGVNCQNIPKPDEKDPEAIDLRGAVIARQGYKIVTIDYSGEELRVAANFSREPKWVKEFVEGEGDLHSVTAKIIYKLPDGVDIAERYKKERSNAKQLNFLTLYGGGAGTFAANAKISFDDAKKMIENFFKGLPVLKKWIDSEIKASRKRGYSRTAFGRRRPLREYYENPDKKIQNKGDRCAVNAAIQGSASDLLKIVLYRVWKWIHENGHENDCRILMPVHDEILFEVKTEKMDFFIPELVRIMTIPDIIQKLQWPVPLTVDAEYGDSYHVDHNYFKELKAQEKASAQAPTPVVITTTNTPKEGSEKVEAPQSNVAALGVPIKGNSSGELSADQLKALFGENGVKEQTSVPVVMDALVKDKIDQQGFLNYPVKVDRTTATQLRCILDILKNDNSMFTGPKVKLRLLSGDGEVWCTVTEGVSLDAFLMMCLWLNI